MNPTPPIPEASPRASGVWQALDLDLAMRSTCIHPAPYQSPSDIEITYSYDPAPATDACDDSHEVSSWIELLAPAAIRRALASFDAAPANEGGLPQLVSDGADAGRADGAPSSVA